MESLLDYKKTILHQLNKPKLEPSPELAYICGVILGDGYLSERHYKGHRSNYLIALSAIDKDFVLTFNRALCKVIGRPTPYAMDKNKDGRYRVRGQSFILYRFLRNLRPDFFKPIAESFPADFIKGIADSEGWVINLKRTRGIGIALTSEDLLHYVQDLLEQHWQILSTIRCRQPDREPATKKDKSLIYSKKVLYTLSIEDKISLDRFTDNIGFSIQRKQEALHQAVLSMSEPRSRRWNLKYVIPEIQRLKAEGLTYQQISKEVNKSLGTIYQLCPVGGGR
jgi:intein-encoded DNA endonuclease-like protein